MLLTETNQSPSVHRLQVCQSRLIDTPAATLQTNTPVAPPLQSAPALLGLHAHRRSLPDGVHTSARVPSLCFQYTRSWADTHTHTPWTSQRSVSCFRTEPRAWWNPGGHLEHGCHGAAGSDSSLSAAQRGRIHILSQSLY